MYNEQPRRGQSYNFAARDEWHASGYDSNNTPSSDDWHGQQSSSDDWHGRQSSSPPTSSPPHDNTYNNFVTANMGNTNLSNTDMADQLSNLYQLNPKYRGELHKFTGARCPPYFFTLERNNVTRAMAEPMIYIMATNFYTQQISLDSSTQIGACKQLLTDIKSSLVLNTQLTPDQKTEITDCTRSPPSSSTPVHLLHRTLPPTSVHFPLLSPVSVSFLSTHDPRRHTLSAAMPPVESVLCGTTGPARIVRAASTEM
ncbi:hypothetical protein FB45DRAFT_1021934 [Roridomyces roridus]|uniref:Uncharacterized protein n=1 Tax=Roridomyces roridus TaxID=1738132 RepID=A0AAD7C7D0_9AGAR|nr:hypothetical protein FB45DRAFT_1021934 [Roridomyces roridus]